MSRQSHTSPDWSSLSGEWRGTRLRARPCEDRSRRSTPTTASWTRRARCRTTGDRNPRSATTTGRCCTGAVSRTARRAPDTMDGRPALVPRARRHLLLRRRVVRRRVPRRDRGLLRAPRVRSHATRYATRDEHVLAIEVACPPQRDRAAKRTITGGYWQSPVFDRALNPGGIWRDRPARVVGSGAHDARARAVRRRVDRAQSPRVQHHARHGDRAPARRTCTPSCAARTTACCSTRGATVDARGRHATSSRGCSPSTTPPRWWPRALGPQTLCDARARRRSRRRRERLVRVARRLPRRAPTGIDSFSSTASACS